MTLPIVVLISGKGSDLAMCALGPLAVRRVAGRIVSVRPALQPLFPGADGPVQAIRAGVRVSDCGVHVFDPDAALSSLRS